MQSLLSQINFCSISFFFFFCLVFYFLNQVWMNPERQLPENLVASWIHFQFFTWQSSTRLSFSRNVFSSCSDVSCPWSASISDCSSAMASVSSIGTLSAANTRIAGQILERNQKEKKANKKINKQQMYITSLTLGFTWYLREQENKSTVKTGFDAFGSADRSEWIR